MFITVQYHCERPPARDTRNAPVRHKQQPVVAITPKMAKGNKKWAIAHWCASPTDDVGPLNYTAATDSMITGYPSKNKRG
jgi:hypothetical protein